MPGGSTPELGNTAFSQVILALITPAASVTAATSTTSTYTINGLTLGQLIVIAPQSAVQALLDIGAAWVSAANTLSIQWVNASCLQFVGVAHSNLLRALCGATDLCELSAHDRQSELADSTRVDHGSHSFHDEHECGGIDANSELYGTVGSCSHRRQGCYLLCQSMVAGEYQ